MFSQTAWGALVCSYFRPQLQLSSFYIWGSPFLKPTGPHAKMPLGPQVRYQSPEQALAIDGRTTASQEQ